MDMKYPHWFHDMSKDECCCECEKEMPMCPVPIPETGKVKKMAPYCHETFKERLNCFLGEEVYFCVNCHTGFCKKGRAYFGVLCYIGCDFVIINTTYRKHSLSLHIPICMLTYIAPCRC